MKTYFDLEATFKGYSADVIVPGNLDLFVLNCEAKLAVNIHSIPKFIDRKSNNSSKKWREFQLILRKAHVESRIYFLLDDCGQQIGTRSLEEIYNNTDPLARYWHAIKQ